MSKNPYLYIDECELPHQNNIRCTFAFRIRVCIHVSCVYPLIYERSFTMHTEHMTHKSGLVLTNTFVLRMCEQYVSICEYVSNRTSNLVLKFTSKL